MTTFEDARLAAALAAVTEIEGAVRFHLETEDGPVELARGWEAYRSAVALRKALSRWGETRRWRAAHAGEQDPEHAAQA